jgi:hypothetical protein
VKIEVSYARVIEAPNTGEIIRLRKSTLKGTSPCIIRVGLIVREIVGSVILSPEMERVGVAMS